MDFDANGLLIEGANATLSEGPGFLHVYPDRVEFRDKRDHLLVRYDRKDADMLRFEGRWNFNAAGDRCEFLFTICAAILERD